MHEKTWGEFIQQLLVAFDLEAKTLAAEIGVTPRTITRWTSRSSQPQGAAGRKLANAFQCSSVLELKAKVEARRRIKQIERSQEIAEARSTQLSGLGREIQLLRFARDPGAQRRHLIADIASLEEVRIAVNDDLNIVFKKLSNLMQSVVVLEEQQR